MIQEENEVVEESVDQSKIKNKDALADIHIEIEELEADLEDMDDEV